MDFHLQFPITPSVEKMNYSQSSLFIGSCFAENIGELLLQNKFKSLLNPNGILYNPSSIAIALRRYISNNLLKESDLFYANECWNSWEHHSRYSQIEKLNCLGTINAEISNAHSFLKNTDWLFISFGSAFIYKRKNAVVGNCHKQPQKDFSKELLETKNIVNEYSLLISDLKKLNPDLKIVFTISPVRYIRDGIVENNLSKARLIDAVHQLIGKNVFYFPAYELVIDDLRDYRFYKKDMVHPSEQALAYVFDKFRETFFDHSASELFVRINEILIAKKHIPFNADAPSHKKFRVNFLNRIQLLQSQNSYLDLREEEAYFS
jgi:hypothetical protein